MMLAAHCFFWGYGEHGYNVLFRSGASPALEAPCLEEVNRWKLAFDREAAFVTPVIGDGRPLAMLAFRTRFVDREAGGKVRETACAALPWGQVGAACVQARLLSLVPALGPADAPAPEAPPAGDEAAPVPWPDWAVRAWARLLNEETVFLGSEVGASLDQALQVVTWLPPAVACRVAVGEGLQPGAAPRRPGLFVADPPAAPPNAAAAAATVEARRGRVLTAALVSLSQAWFARERPAWTGEPERAAAACWAQVAAAAGCELGQLDRARLLRIIVSDAAMDRLLPDPAAAGGEEPGRWLDPALEAGHAPDPGRLAQRLAAVPAALRPELPPALERLAARLPEPDAELASVLVGAAYEQWLVQGPSPAPEAAGFDASTWIGAMLEGRSGLGPSPVFAQVAWKLFGESLGAWALQRPAVLARALDTPERPAPDAAPGVLDRLVRKVLRPRTVEDLLQGLVALRGPSLPRLARPWLPAMLRTPEALSALRPPDAVLQDLFVRAVLLAARNGARRDAVSAAALLPLWAARQAPPA